MNASPDWSKDFFSGLVVAFWRSALPPEVTLLETRFLVGAADGDPYRMGSPQFFVVCEKPRAARG